jgi:hypothetical protein
VKLLKVAEIRVEIKQFVDDANHSQSRVVYGKVIRQIEYFELRIMVIPRKTAIVAIRLGEVGLLTADRKINDIVDDANHP